MFRNATNLTNTTILADVLEMGSGVVFGYLKELFVVSFVVVAGFAVKWYFKRKHKKLIYD